MEELLEGLFYNGVTKETEVNGDTPFNFVSLVSPLLFFRARSL